MKEACVVVGFDGEALRWELPAGRTAVTIPDSADLWRYLWENRAVIAGIAHSHPGSGVPSPSHTDVTTFAAIEDGLGRKLKWWIATDDSLVILTWAGPHKHTYAGEVVHEDPSWLDRLRAETYTKQEIVSS
jgi:hypothetical protein